MSQSIKEKKNVMILFGGGGTEHDVSKISSNFIYSKLENIPEINPILVEITKEGFWQCDGRKCSLNGKILKTPTEQPYIDYVIPCIHGPPGETGEIQSYLKTIGIPYFGPGPEASINCFNKVTTKLWFDLLEIPNTEWKSVNKYSEYKMEDLEEFYTKVGGDIFIKAANQGSSVGCFHVTEKEKIQSTIKEAFNYSDNLLLERTIKGRELEIAVFEYDGKVHVTEPGEVICPDGFYTYEEKYSKQSHTKTTVKADGIDEEVKKQMMNYAKKAFKALGLRHLSRVDFFLADGKIYLNEINTFPGMTPISMFPQMLEATGLKFEDYLKQAILND